MSIIKIKTKERGIGLVETIVALGITIVVLTSLVSLSLYTLRSSQQSKYLLEASKLATEELERVRAVRDITEVWSDFEALVVGPSNPCISTSPCRVSKDLVIGHVSSPYPYTDPENPQYARYFTAAEIPPDSDIIRISVTVSYTIGGQTKAVHNYTDLTNWRGN